MQEKKVNILLLGTLRSGKSTIGNVILGSEYFETSEEAERCTIKFNQKEINDLKIIDSPGFNDPKMLLNEWLVSL